MKTPIGWEIIEGKLVRSLTFSDFAEAMQFINSIAQIAEEQHHHPEIWNSYATVRLTLSTHDAGDVATEKDIVLAEGINALRE